MTNPFEGRQDLLDLLADLVRGISGRRAALVASATINRTDTTPKALFTILAGHEAHALIVNGEFGSDAGTSAILDIGLLGGSATTIVNGLSVLGAAGVGQKAPDARHLGQVNANDQTMTGRYTETGAASTTGGPWTVSLIYSRAGN